MAINKKFFTYVLYFRYVVIITIQIFTAISAIAAIFFLTMSNEDLHRAYNYEYGPFKLRHVVTIGRANATRSSSTHSSLCGSLTMLNFNYLLENALQQQFPETVIHSYFRYKQQGNSQYGKYCVDDILKYELDTADFSDRFGINLLSYETKLLRIVDQIRDIIRYTTPEPLEIRYYGYGQEQKQHGQTISLLFAAIFFIPAIFIIYIKNKMNFLLVSLLSWVNSFIIGIAVVYFASLFTQAFNYRSIVTTITLLTIAQQLLFTKRFETTFYLNRLYFEQKEDEQIEYIEKNFQLDQQNQLIKLIQMGITIPRTQRSSQKEIEYLQYGTIVKTAYNFYSNMLSTETILLCCHLAIFGFLALIPHKQFACIAVFSAIQVIICYGINQLNTLSMVIVCENMFFRSHSAFRDNFTAKSAYEILINQDSVDEDLPVAPQQPINYLLDFIKELSDEENQGQYLDQLEDGDSDVMMQREKQKLLYKEIVNGSQNKLAKVLNVKIAMRQIESQKFARIIIYVVYAFALATNIFCIANSKFGVNFSQFQQKKDMHDQKLDFSRSYYMTDIYPLEFNINLTRPINIDADLERLFYVTIEMFNTPNYTMPFFCERFYSFTDLGEIRQRILQGSASADDIRAISVYNELGGQEGSLYRFRGQLHYNCDPDGEDFKAITDKLRDALSKGNYYLKQIGADFSMSCQISSIQAVLADNAKLQQGCFWAYALFSLVALYFILALTYKSFIAPLKFVLCAILLHTSGVAAIYTAFQLFYNSPKHVDPSISYIIFIVSMFLQVEFAVKMRECTDLNRSSMVVAQTISLDIALFVSSIALFLTNLRYLDMLGFGMLCLAFVYAIYVSPYLYTALNFTLRKDK